MALPALPSTGELYPIPNSVEALDLARAIESPMRDERGRALLRRAMTRDERGTLSRRLATINDALHPGNAAKIKVVVMQMLIGLSPNRKTSDDDFKVAVTQFVVALSDLPYFAVARACLKFVRGRVTPAEVGAEKLDVGWCPNTAQVHMVAAKIADPHRDEQTRLARVLGAKVEEPEPPPEERERVGALLTGLAEHLKRGVDEQRMIERDQNSEAIERAQRKRLEFEQRTMLAEYERLGIEPIYAGDVLVSPMLAKKLAAETQPRRHHDDDSESRHG